MVIKSNLINKALETMTHKGKTQDDIDFVVVAQGSMRASWSTFAAQATDLDLHMFTDVDAELCIVGKEECGQRWWMEIVDNDYGYKQNWTFQEGSLSYNIDLLECNVLTRSIIMT